MTEARKLTDLIKGNQFSYSFEITPDSNKEEIIGLETVPTFFSVTWHAKSHKCRGLEIPPLEMAKFLRSQGKQVLMHLSCDMMQKEYLERVLAYLQENGICNLFLVLGESYDAGLSEFKSTLELISYIREISGHYFCIGVAGFCECDDNKLLQLKENVVAGANFVITQAFFEADLHRTFKSRCKKAGISIPIISGIFPFENYNQLINFTNMCKVKVSNDILKYVKNNEEREIEGCVVIKNLVQNIRAEFPGAHFHFFTLNKLNNIGKILNEIQK